MKQSGVESAECLLEKGVTGSFFEAESLEEIGVEVDKGDKVTVAEFRVELESEENKEGGKGVLDWSTKVGGPGRDHIAKIHKLIKKKVTTASFGRVV
jgi:hypothetical protein